MNHGKGVVSRHECGHAILGKVVYIVNHTTLNHGHWKFAVRYTPHLRLGVYLLQMFNGKFSQEMPAAKRSASNFGST